MVFWGTESTTAIISYVLAFYTLTVWCFKIPYLIRFFKTFKNENRYARLWQDDTRLRVNVSLYGTLIYNTAYALLQLGMGFWHHTFWFYSLAGYYICLAVTRFFLVRHTSKHKPGEKCWMNSKIPYLRYCVPCDEPGAYAHDFLYGLLEQNLYPSRNHDNYLGGLYLCLVNRCYYQYY